MSHILQTIVAGGLNSPATRKLLDDARDGYMARRHSLSEALKGSGLNTSQTASGFNLWIPLPRDAKDVGYELAKRGWLVRLGSAFDIQGTSQAIRVTVSRLEPDVAQRFAHDLKRCAI